MKLSMCIILLFHFLCFGFTSYEREPSKLTLSDIDPEMQTKIISDMAISILSSEPSTVPITCFAISESGQLAVGWYAGSKKTVCVYSNTGEFQYGYEFLDNGSFEVDWEGEQIAIYLIRGSKYIVLDKNGQCISLKEIDDTLENDQYFRNYVSATQQVVNGDTYKMRNTGFIQLGQSYIQVVKTTANGETTILYDADSTVSYSFAPFMVFLFAFVCSLFIVIGTLVTKVKKQVSFIA